MKAEDFWDWFKINNNRFYFLNQIDDPSLRNSLLDEFQKALHKFSKELSFVIGGFPDKSQELIITANGDKDYFHKVIELTNAAPQVDNWHIIAFKPPQDIDFSTEYNGLTLTPKNMWFLPLNNRKSPDLIGIKVGWRNYNSLVESLNLDATRVILEHILGEKSFAEDITYFTIGALPESPSEEGYIKISELPQYILWKRSKK